MTVSTALFDDIPPVLSAGAIPPKATGNPARVGL